MGKIFVFRRIKLKFSSWLYKKRWHTSWKFQLEIRSNKKVIAKKRLTNLYEMNSNFYVFTIHLNVHKWSQHWIWLSLEEILQKMWKVCFIFCSSVLILTLYFVINYTKPFSTKCLLMNACCVELGWRHSCLCPKP